MYISISVHCHFRMVNQPKIQVFMIKPWSWFQTQVRTHPFLQTRYPYALLLHPALFCLFWFWVVVLMRLRFGWYVLICHFWNIQGACNCCDYNFMNHLCLFMHTHTHVICSNPNDPSLANLQCPALHSDVFATEHLYHWEAGRKMLTISGDFAMWAIHLSIYLSIYLYLYLYLSLSQSIYIYLNLSISISIYLWLSINACVCIYAFTRID